VTDDQLTCPHCGSRVFRKSSGGTRYKARTPIVVLHKSGELEINCAGCRRGVILPTTFKSDNPVLRKAILTVRKT
jgi:DNA-directed RNA polymerase subunit RPC12/RpoP